MKGKERITNVEYASNKWNWKKIEWKRKKVSERKKNRGEQKSGEELDGAD